MTMQTSYQTGKTGKTIRDRCSLDRSGGFQAERRRGGAREGVVKGRAAGRRSGGPVVKRIGRVVKPAVGVVAGGNAMGLSEIW
jgi:hypothetical protein